MDFGRLRGGGLTPTLVKERGQLCKGLVLLSLVFDLEEDAERVKFVGGEADLVVVDVRGDEPQEQLQVCLHKVQNDLIIVMQIVHLGYF